MSREINPYYALGKILEKSVDYDLVKDFIERYIKIEKNKGEKPDDVIMKLKNASTELHDAIMTNCVRIQSSIEADTPQYNTDEWISVNKAAEICGVKPASIHNWIKRTIDPLQSKNLGKRKTVVLFSDLKRFATTHTPKKT